MDAWAFSTSANVDGEETELLIDYCPTEGLILIEAYDHQSDTWAPLSLSDIDIPEDVEQYCRDRFRARADAEDLHNVHPKGHLFDV